MSPLKIGQLDYRTRDTQKMGNFRSDFLRPILTSGLNSPLSLDDASLLKQPQMIVAAEPELLLASQLLFAGNLTGTD